MNFQENLSRSACGEEEAEKKQNEQLELEVSAIVAGTLVDIQDNLMEKAQNAEYVFEEQHKYVACATVLPYDIQQCLYMHTKTVTTSPKESSLLRQTIGKSAKETRKMHKDYMKANGGILDFSIMPGSSKEINYFGIYDDKRKLYEKYIEMLIKAMQQEHILGEVKLMKDNGIDNVTFYDFPVTIKGYEHQWDFSLVCKCKCEIIDDFKDAKNLETIELDATDDDFFYKIDSMEGHQFESFCADILVKNGFNDVMVTSGSGDQGIDVIAYKDGIKYGIQCKCYSADIGNKAVQEAFSGKSFYNCHVGVVLTNRYFTRSAIELAQKNKIVLWDRDALSKMLENI